MKLANSRGWKKYAHPVLQRLNVVIRSRFFEVSFPKKDHEECTHWLNNRRGNFLDWIILLVRSRPLETVVVAWRREGLQVYSKILLFQDSEILCVVYAWRGFFAWNCRNCRDFQTMFNTMN